MFERTRLTADFTALLLRHSQSDGWCRFAVAPSHPRPLRPSDRFQWERRRNATTAPAPAWREGAFYLSFQHSRRQMKARRKPVFVSDGVLAAAENSLIYIPSRFKKRCECVFNVYLPAPVWTISHSSVTQRNNSLLFGRRNGPIFSWLRGLWAWISVTKLPYFSNRLSSPPVNLLQSVFSMNWFSQGEGEIIQFLVAFRLKIRSAQVSQFDFKVTLRNL